MSIKAKKSLGQNFLIDKNIINKIVSISKISNNDILEIGPGTGNLTEFILKKNPSNLFLIEKDKILCEYLEKKFKNNVKIFNQDVLRFDESNISKKKLIVFGNLPYNISTEIICNWLLKLDNNFWFSELILMFQKEVADRITSKINTSDYGRLSILLNWKMNIKKFLILGQIAFFQNLKLIARFFILLQKKFFSIEKSKNLEMVTRIFFNQRRKMIKNPLKQLFRNPEEISKKLRLDMNLRPQNLSLEMYCKIVREYEKLNS